MNIDHRGSLMVPNFMIHIISTIHLVPLQVFKGPASPGGPHGIWHPKEHPRGPPKTTNFWTLQGTGPRPEKPTNLCTLQGTGTRPEKPTNLCTCQGTGQRRAKQETRAHFERHQGPGRRRAHVSFKTYLCRCIWHSIYIYIYIYIHMFVHMLVSMPARGQTTSAETPLTSREAQTTEHTL